ncbi:paraquat-inducible protein A [Mycetohabitans rhizoxinica]|jgi:paraquat-inducible protein A|uniref:paraquat-inducible protein A n=1 Tax=Mycetohabitans TaxID=2571159 RepID=UPI001F388153|nr:paraquat-inducible protein A [Mycetohabitans sp. B2]MCF7694854.1 paraquat-inducible protein A [Mycetohabitans sp. B2]
MDPTELIACHQCDALHYKRALHPGTVARCARCGAVLYRGLSGRLDRVSAMTLAALITFVIAQAAPIVQLETNGIVTQTTLAAAIAALWAENSQVIAVLVLCSTTLFPLAELCALLYLLFSLRAGIRPYAFDELLRMIQWIRPWGMIEVFMLGILVALVKLSSLADMRPEAALFAFGALTLMIASVVTFDPRVLWDVADRLDEGVTTCSRAARHS